jgi:hypothetical protein
MPLAPGLLSTTIGWPSVLDMWSAKARAIWSVALPAAKGTTSFTGREGKSLGVAREREQGGGGEQGEGEERAAHGKPFDQSMNNVAGASR